MGRRFVRLADQERWVFNRVAAAYLAARPPYPADLVDRLATLAAAGGGPVVDLGAGTGHLALPLAARGLEVVAVEPAQEMLSRLGAALAEAPREERRVSVVHATAEATGLPAGAFDLAILADALQWVDPERAGAEARRLLRAGGIVAVVEAAFAPTPFMDGLRRLLVEANPKARPRPPGALRQLLTLATGRRASEANAAHEERFVQDAAIPEERLAPLLASMTNAGPALGPARFGALVTAARALARAAGGARFTRDLSLCWAVRPP